MSPSQSGTQEIRPSWTMLLRTRMKILTEDCRINQVQKKTITFHEGETFSSYELDLVSVLITGILDRDFQLK
jgi:hypothetical protein